jgi:hypothetical protein
MTPTTAPESLRPRGQLRAYIAVTLFVVMTVGSAGLTVMMPGRHRPTPAARLHDELVEIAAARRTRIAALEATVGDRCERRAAHERTMLLVQDGRWAEARRYADAYEARCGADANVRRWANAPVPRLVALR